jgi:nucleotide-binding universal stress UspA family protein
MSLPKNIIYPVDFSDRSRVVWPAVTEMAAQLGVPVTVLHALDVEQLELVATSAEMAVIREQMGKKLEHFPTPGLDAVTIRRELLEGSAAVCIVDFAASLDAPLIMMPTKGHTRFRRLLLGSVTAAVLHDANYPLWTEAHVENKPVPTGIAYSIVCAIDMGLGTPRVLRSASEFSGKFGAPLHVIHSVPGIDPRFPSGAANRAHAYLIDQAREDFPVHCRNADVSFALEIVEDAGLVNGIVGAIAKHGANLLIIGRGVI